MTLTLFGESIEDLRDALPQWWATAEAGSELALQLGVLAELIDELSAEAEGIYADMSMATARADALREEWALLYGAASEQLPPTAEALRAYLQARAGEDGTIRSLERALLALLATEVNNTGTPLHFPSDGSGLHFPSDGSGIGPLYQYSFAGANALRFPDDGSGLQFPEHAGALEFPTGGRVEIHDHPSDNTLEVDVRSFLAFDRAAFARAVERHRPADYLPPVIRETSA